MCTITQGNAYSTVVNAGEVVVKGFELEGRWAISDTWSARAAYSYNEGEKSNGDPLESIVPASGVVGVRYAPLSGRWSVTGNVTHAAAKKREDATITETDDVFQALQPDFLSDAYTVVDLLGTFQVSDNLRLTAGVYSLLDEEYYQRSRIRQVRAGTNTLYGYVTGEGIGRYSEPGRNLRVTVAYDF